MAVKKAKSKTVTAEVKTVNVGVIDISSTGVSALALECEGYAPQSFIELGYCDEIIEPSEFPSRTLFKGREEHAILSYVEGLSLNERGIEKIIGSVKTYLDKFAELNVAMCYTVATAISRAIDNFDAVKAAVEAACGVNVTTLEGEDEAICDAIANHSDGFDNSYLIDIGTASIEFSDLGSDLDFEFMSMPFGIYHLSTLVKDTHPTKKECKKIRDYLLAACELAPFDYMGRESAVLVGATANAIYNLYAEKFGISKVEARREMQPHKLKKLTKFLVEDEGRNMLILKTAPERLHTITTSCVLLDSLINFNATERVFVSPYGLKEGLPFYAPTAGIFPTLLKPEEFDECKQTIFLLEAEKSDCMPPPAPEKKSDKKRKDEAKKSDKDGKSDKKDKNGKVKDKKKKSLILLPNKHDLEVYWDERDEFDDITSSDNQ